MKVSTTVDRIRDTPIVSYDDDIDDTWRKTGWAELPFFLAAARTGTLRGAAQLLKVNHATVDRHIKALELSYGVTLFERNQQGLTLTSAGAGLFEKAAVAEVAVMEAKRRVSGMDDRPAGHVHLSLSHWHSCYQFSKEMTRFRALYPDINLRISVSDRVEDLTQSPADISIRAAWHVDEDVIGRKIGTYSVAVLASREYLATHWDNRGPNGEGLHWVGQSTLWPNPKLDALNLFPAAKRDLDVREPILINELLSQGCGMAIVPLDASVMYPNLTIVPGTPHAEDRTIWVLYHSDLRNSARVKVVVNFLADMVQRSLDVETEILRSAGLTREDLL